jgi:hypothetical protein
MDDDSLNKEKTPRENALLEAGMDGGSIGQENDEMEEQGWQRIGSRRADKRPQGASTGASPEKPDAQRQATHFYSNSGCGSIALLQNANENVTDEHVSACVDVAAAANENVSTDMRIAEPPTAARRARAVGGSIVAAACSHDAANTMNWGGSWRQADRSESEESYRSYFSTSTHGTSHLGQQLERATFEEQPNQVKAFSFDSSRHRLETLCAGHASKRVADPRDGKSLSSSEGLFTFGFLPTMNQYRMHFHGTDYPILMLENTTHCHGGIIALSATLECKDSCHQRNISNTKHLGLYRLGSLPKLGQYRMHFHGTDHPILMLENTTRCHGGIIALSTTLDCKDSCHQRNISNTKHLGLFRFGSLPKLGQYRMHFHGTECPIMTPESTTHSHYGNKAPSTTLNCKDPYHQREIPNIQHLQKLLHNTHGLVIHVLSTHKNRCHHLIQCTRARKSLEVGPYDITHNGGGKLPFSHFTTTQ